MKFPSLNDMLAHAQLHGTTNQAHHLLQYGRTCMGTPAEAVFYFNESGYSIALFPHASTNTILMDPVTRPQLYHWQEESVVHTPEGTVLSYRHRNGNPLLQLIAAATATPSCSSSCSSTQPRFATTPTDPVAPCGTVSSTDGTNEEENLMDPLTPETRTFKVQIVMDKNEMRHPRNVARALERLARNLRDVTGSIVGQWELGRDP